MAGERPLERGLLRLSAWLAPVMPASRLALVRVVVGLYACVWLAMVAPDLMRRSALGAAKFEPLGIATWSGMVAPGVVMAVIGVTGGLGIAMVLGLGHRGLRRAVGPAFAVGVLWLASYRNSWGHLSHGEHLMVLQLLVLAVAPTTDAVRVRWPGGKDVRAGDEQQPRESERYGWPLRVIMLVTVSTYAIAGLAKLRGAGWAWISGEAVRLHVGHEALRMTLVGESGWSLGAWLLPHAWVFTAAAVGTVVLELGAPIGLRRGWVGIGWIAGLWAMHVGIWVVMGIGFPYPLSGVAFAAWLPLERVLTPIRRLIGGRSSDARR
ncbi:hypothetical protein [Paraliomyxa miuraensis]|uniref:hypothetical protein n=1 Tax=Paraliomyxa miuraensis TaxID=376150 RepID=UPI0022580C84|nr:hypothetical protein [Paraliomyxa miuraensis]MCX4243481.1 hypothetical protein [Paraliomyxa miuraensis]